MRAQALARKNRRLMLDAYTLTDARTHGRTQEDTATHRADTRKETLTRASQARARTHMHARTDLEPSVRMHPRRPTHTLASRRADFCGTLAKSRCETESVMVCALPAHPTRDFVRWRRPADLEAWNDACVRLLVGFVCNGSRWVTPFNIKRMGSFREAGGRGRTGCWVKRDSSHE